MPLTDAACKNASLKTDEKSVLKLSDEKGSKSAG